MLTTEALSETVAAIAQDATLAEVALALQSDGIRPLLVRGPAVARWLYNDPRERPYGDVDLIVAPELFDAAGATLARLGFVDTSEGLREDERHPNESHWFRAQPIPVTVDLHHSLALIAVDAEEAWRLLIEGARKLRIAGVDIDVPADPAHLVVLALHAAHHGVEHRKPLGDLRRAIERVDHDSWRDAAALAAALGVRGAMREGLELVEGGRELADDLVLRASGSRVERLYARTPPPTSSGIEHFLRTRGLRARVALVLGRVVPSPAYMRQWKTIARRGRAGLALAYLWRPLWLAWHVPGGVAAWCMAALPRERRRRVPGFIAGALWAARSWRRCHRQLRRGGLDAVRLRPPPGDRPGTQNGVTRVLEIASATCLESALVRQRWLAARGRPLDVIIGVHGPASEFRAHAWLDGEPQEPGVFTELKRWPAPLDVPAFPPAHVAWQPAPARAPAGSLRPPRGEEDLADPSALGRVVLVHDYLNQHGGAEMVVLELGDIWPTAPIYTSLYRPDSTFRRFREHEIRTSFLQRSPFDEHFRALFPLYPAAFRSLGEIDGDVVIASSSGWAHMARVVPEALHVVYCHTPARWLYRADYLGSSTRWGWREQLIRPLAGEMRRVDRHAAARADLYIANSREVQTRIRNAYGIEAAVVHPPVRVEHFTPMARGERLLAIARLMPYKRVDLVVRAASELGIALDVVGEGPMLESLRAIAGRGVTFHGAVSDSVLTGLLETCRAVCVAGEEDFGMVPVEAQAAGKPVVAYAGGGALETVRDGVTGVLFREQTVESLVAAIRAVEKLDTPPEEIAANAQLFSRAAFRRNLITTIRKRLAR
jgi:glycosyltransferase involved in cell wall biosynthesis